MVTTHYEFGRSDRLCVQAVAAGWVIRLGMLRFRLPFGHRFNGCRALGRSVPRRERTLYRNNVIRGPMRSRSARSGSSLLEIVVVVVIVLILLALSIPLVQNMREVTRRRNCDRNLIRLAAACQAYASIHNHFPSGSVSYNAELEIIDSPSELNVTAQTQSVRSLPDGYHHNWISAILPHLDRQGLFESINFKASVYDESNRLPREADLAPLRCPSVEDIAIANTTNYAGSASSEAIPIQVNNDGLLFLNRWIDPSNVPDGLAYTLIIGEKLSPPPDDLSWMSGTRSSIRNSGHGINHTFFGLDTESYDATEFGPLFVGGWGSLHAGGASLVMADGAVEFVTESIDADLLQAKACRNDR